MEKAEGDIIGIKENVREEVEESEKIYKNKRKCNEKKRKKEKAK